MTRKLAAAVLLAVAAAGCEQAAEDPDAGPVRFADELNIDLDRMEQSPTGLWIEDVEPGSGEPARPGQLVTVHYTGWLPDGSEFDSSRNRGTPYDLVIGQGIVIAGWDEGIPGMRPGGRRKLVIPPELAYGAAGRGPAIPPNATLVFDVELVAVSDVTPPPMPGDTTGAAADTANAAGAAGGTIGGRP